MSNIKLLQLEIDNRWGSAALNEIKFTFGADKENCQTIKVPCRPELCEQILDVMLPFISNELNTMFESLTGSDSPDVPTLQTQEPFLSPEVDPIIERLEDESRN